MTRRAGADFRRRLHDSLAELVGPAMRAEGAGRPPLVVAFSGGLDSCALLHALRFFDGAARPVVAAHFDHAMRPGSAEDAAWSSGVCRAWGVRCHTGRAAIPPTSEADARRARYDFLTAVRDDIGGGAILTAHHADDQAETVLFRALRGTGIAGLRGVRASRDPGVYRPLLECWREELADYADDVGLRWREDPTNEHLGYARNALRHDFLPALEERVAPGARRALVRLAAHARGEEAAWAEAMEVVFRTIGVRDRSVDVEAARALGPELRARILREMAQREGVTLDRAATRRAIDFVVQGRSGSAVELGGGLELRRELDRLSVREVDAGVPDAEDRELRIDGAGPGEATVTLGGRTRSVRWWPGRPSGSGTTSGRAHFPTNGLRFPLLVRARRPGDRISLRGGSRPLKKVLMESRVPSLERGRIPVVADAEGRLLWVAGVARAAEPVVVDDENRTMTVEIEE